MVSAKRGKRLFYAQAVEDARTLIEASEVEGIDEELALLRLRFRQIASDKDKEPDFALMCKGMHEIIRALRIQYQLSARSADDLAEHMAAVVTSLTSQTS